MTRYNIYNWDDLSGDNPELVTLRNEALRQLRGVPEPSRSVWEERLKDKLGHSHSSARLEICLHDFFRERGWEIEIEPELPNTRNKPDFRLTRGDRTVMVEAKAALGNRSESQQDGRLMRLMADLRGKLNRTVMIHPMLDLPSSLPNRHIAAQIERKTSDVELLQEFLVEGEHQGHSYSLEVVVLLEAKPNQSADVGATLSQAVEVEIGNPVRKAIIEKARKYGEIRIPYIIAVWPKLANHFSFSDDDMIALYGDREPEVSSYGQSREVPKPNGVFTTKKEDGSFRYADISAVLFCHPYNTDSSKIYIHHNPFAKRPVGMDMFKGIPQSTLDLATGQARWSNQ